jgi:hypothetical protein
MGPVVDVAVIASGACAPRSEERHAFKVLAGSPPMWLKPAWCTSATGPILQTAFVGDEQAELLSIKYHCDDAT